MNRKLALALLAFSALAFSACGQKRAPETLPPQPGAEMPVAGNNSEYDVNGNYIGPGNQAEPRLLTGSV